MAKGEIVSKRLQISKANVFIVTVVSAACFITVFSLVASRTLFSQQQYQAKVIEQKEVAQRTLAANIEARDSLMDSYEAFALSGVNMIGGYISGTGDQDGDNPQLVLDSLPSKYDYPALVTSLEKVLGGIDGTSIKAISGIDDSLAQNDAASTEPAPVEMPFTIDVETNLAGADRVLGVLERSIRPIKATSMTMSGTDGNLKITIEATSYYQPGKAFNVKKSLVAR